MADNFLSKLIIILIYIGIIILIPIFLEYLFRITVRRKRKNKIMELAKIRAETNKKDLIVITSPTSGYIKNLSNNNIEYFKGNIYDILENIRDDSAVIIVDKTLEYYENPTNIIQNINRVSNNNAYYINIEKNSPRTFIDYKLKNIMNKSFYLPNERVKWTKANDLQTKVQNFYYYVFKILPYNSIMDNN